MMTELTETEQTILEEYLESLYAGGDIESCLARHPQHSEALRPFLELNARMFNLDQPEPPADAYEAGKQALLERIAASPSTEGRGGLVAAFGLTWGKLSEQIQASVTGGWNRLGSPLARIAAVSALVFALGGGALGASAGFGFQPAREVLSALNVMDEPSHEEEADSASDEEIAEPPASDHDGEEPVDEEERDNSGTGNADDPDHIDKTDNSGPGNADDPDHIDETDNSGPGNADDPDHIDETDNSGPGNADGPVDEEEPVHEHDPVLDDETDKSGADDPILEKP